MDKNYTTLFNAITSAVQDLEKVKFSLMSAQTRAEESYISGQPSASILLLHKEVPPMDKKMESILDRFHDYIKSHKYFDIVESSFGITVLRYVGEEEVVAEVIEDIDGLVSILVYEITQDVADQKLFGERDRWFRPQEIELARKRLTPYFAGLSFEAECFSIMEDFFANNPYKEIGI